MMEIQYDFHIHSCLSPCGDDESTPNNIVGMAVLNGLTAIALTDHNSCKNCPATVEAGRKNGLLVIPGMELCTSEEAHVVCLFSSLDGAMEFDKYVASRAMPVKNNPEKFGRQLILDADDHVIGQEDTLLITAADISLEGLVEKVRTYGGGCFPAHIDKSAYSVIASLGMIPPELGFRCVELSKSGSLDTLLAAHPYLAGMPVLRDSDAHYLWDISEGEQTLSLSTLSENAVVRFLNGEGN